jgi:hypothetical protein
MLLPAIISIVIVVAVFWCYANKSACENNELFPRAPEPSEFDIEEANKNPEFRMGKYVKAYVCHGCGNSEDWLFAPRCCPECGGEKFNFVVGKWKEVKQIAYDGLYVRVYWGKVEFTPKPTSNRGDV